VFHADPVEHAYLLGFTANNNCSHLFTEQTSLQDSRIMSRILPEAEGSHCIMLSPRLTDAKHLALPLTQALIVSLR
jgi:hypothetical protein